MSGLNFLMQMTPLEKRATFSLASIMSLRMLGLFMVLPIFSLYAHSMAHASPLLIGLSLGIYGLTQGMLQIPFGMLSDFIGRKTIIIFGLILLAIGSMIAATTHSIYLLIVGRAMQGAGAIGSTIMAFIADFTSITHRTKAMAICGMSIGFSFSLAMILGPFLASFILVSGLFWLTVFLSLIAILIVLIWTPSSPSLNFQPEVEANYSDFSTILKNRNLMCLNIGIFLLHAILTASFVAFPITIQSMAGLSIHQQWKLYLPILLLAFLLCIPVISLAEKTFRLKNCFMISIVVIIISEILLWLFAKSLLISGISLLLFFTAFSILEAFLPSLISKSAPPHRKGTALGIYSSMQFLGIFIGGTIGGWLYGKFGLVHVYLLCVAFGMLWLIVASFMEKK